jgi:hypothetical protein
LARADANEPDRGVAALQLQRLVDGGEYPVGRVCGPGDVGVRQDRKELWRGAAQDSRRVDVTHSAGEGCGHRLEDFFGWSGAIGLDEQNAEISLVAVGPGKLVLEDWAYETIVEEAGRSIDDVEWLGLRVIGPDSARWAEHSALRQWRSASQACLSFRPAA